MRNDVLEFYSLASQTGVLPKNVSFIATILKAREYSARAREVNCEFAQREYRIRAEWLRLGTYGGGIAGTILALVSGGTLTKAIPAGLYAGAALATLTVGLRVNRMWNQEERRMQDSIGFLEGRRDRKIGAREGLTRILEEAREVEAQNLRMLFARLDEEMQEIFLMQFDPQERANFLRDYSRYGGREPASRPHQLPHLQTLREANSLIRVAGFANLGPEARTWSGNIISGAYRDAFSTMNCVYRLVPTILPTLDENIDDLQRQVYEQRLRYGNLRRHRTGNRELVNLYTERIAEWHEGNRWSANRISTSPIPCEPTVSVRAASPPPRPFANGGLVTRPHMGLVGEAGPEAIIPLSSNRRGRGLALWQQAGEMLGVRQYAPGGTVSSAISTGTAGVNVEHINIAVSVDGSASPAQTVDAIANNLAARLQQCFINMPLAATS